MCGFGKTICRCCLLSMQRYRAAGLNAKRLFVDVVCYLFEKIIALFELIYYFLVK